MSRIALAIVCVVLIIALMFAGSILVRRKNERLELARQHDMTSAIAMLRTEITDYRKQRGRYPHALSELPKVPVDPVTRSATTWQPELEESVSVDDFTAKSTAPEKFVVNVRSGAKGRDANGRAWSDY